MMQIRNYLLPAILLAVVALAATPPAQAQDQQRSCIADADCEFGDLDTIGWCVKDLQGISGCVYEFIPCDVAGEHCSAYPGDPGIKGMCDVNLHCLHWYDGQQMQFSAYDADDNQRPDDDDPCGQHDSGDPLAQHDTENLVGQHDTDPHGQHDLSGLLGQHDVEDPVGQHDSGSPVEQHDMGDPEVGQHDSDDPMGQHDDQFVPITPLDFVLMNWLVGVPEVEQHDGNERDGEDSVDTRGEGS